MSARPFGTSVVTLLLASAVLAGTPATARAQKAEHFTAFAVNMSGNAPGVNTATVDILIDRWSTDAERQKLFATLTESSQDKLLNVVQDMPSVGRIRTPDRVGYDLRYARRTVGADGTERIVVLTDRPVGFWEASNRPRVNDYPFSVIEMHIGPNGKGEGKLSVATKITFDKDTKTVTLENYGQQPVMLNEVKREKN